MSVLPVRFDAMLDQGLETVKDGTERESLRLVANTIAISTWQHWQAWRPPEDNRQEHEWIVFANVMKIAEYERLTLSEKRVAIAFSFIHDTFFIHRIMEATITALEVEADKYAQSDPDRAAACRDRAQNLRISKRQQRQKHMEGGAKNAEFLLSQLNHPERSDEPLMTLQEIQRCVDIIARHDHWKIGIPYPPGEDRLAVACLEGDALWPLHPLGVLADLERPDAEGKTLDVTDPENWRKQLKESLQTLLKYKDHWTDTINGEPIFRSPEGYRLYRQWRDFWRI